jgi:glycogen debranching enzyme
VVSDVELAALMMPVADSALPTAGIPWYAVWPRFALASCESLIINPEVATGTLLVLAELQAHEDGSWRDAEPGKIPHELRVGELARMGHIPHTPYYGTVDAAPLFLTIAGATTAGRSTLRRSPGYVLRWTRRSDGFRSGGISTGTGS